MGKQYAERDIESLDEAGGFYSRHVSAMTGEGLHSKSSIAAELGHRDMVISELLEALINTVQYLDDIAYQNDAQRIIDAANLVITKATGETK